jgi:hypothetical protein
MTITSRERPVPTHLPAARLYLEDIGEIVRILGEAAAEREQELGFSGNDLVSRVKFFVGDVICDDIQDLPRIAKRPKEFELQVAKEKLRYEATFGVNEFNTQWTSYGLKKEEALVVYNDLMALFERRKLRWADLLHSHKRISYWIYGFIGGALYVLLLGLPFLHLLHHATLEVTAFVVVGLLFTALRAGLKQHSIVILRNSWDQAALREDRNSKILIGAVTTTIGAVLGILGYYLKRKYWP